MRKLLIPFLAAFALPTAVDAESYYLIAGTMGRHNWTIPMKSIEDCEKSLARVIDKNNWEGDTRGDLILL